MVQHPQMDMPVTGHAATLRCLIATAPTYAGLIHRIPPEDNQTLYARFTRGDGQPELWVPQDRLSGLYGLMQRRAFSPRYARLHAQAGATLAEIGRAITGVGNHYLEERAAAQEARIAAYMVRRPAAATPIAAGAPQDRPKAA